MNLSLTQLRERIAVPPSDVTTIGDSIIRFTRKAEGRPFAVYYFDVSQKLPSTQEMLTKYQDSVIGTYYFDDRKSLQWNNYLYFILDREHLDDKAHRDTIDLIEHDRSYARKLVISEDEVDSVLRPPIVTPSGATPRPNILSVWTSLLIEVGMDEAILTEADTPARLELIESSLKRQIPKTRSSNRDTTAEPVPFLRSLELKTFREYPLKRHFTFGKVNLIFGVNGSGKTSLLEAVELFYCGRNRRNPEDHPAYSLIGVNANNETETATNNRKTQEFRNRNLVWYGQPEILTNYLYQSFSQFNFLDTDAAVRLSDSTSRFDDDLSKLLVGSDASKMWDNIGRVHRGLNETLRGLRPQESQFNEEITILQNRIQEASAVPHESSSIGARLGEMMRRIGWQLPEDNEASFEGTLLEPLSELGSLAKQAAELEWVASPVSINELAKYCQTAKATITKAEPEIGILDTLQKQQRQLNNVLRSDREALDLIENAKRIIDAGVPSRFAERKKQQDTVATHSNNISGLNEDNLSEISTAYHGMTVTDFYETTSLKRSAAEAYLAEANREYSSFSKLRTESLNLSQELRRIATRIIQSCDRSDECPLCHTQFGSGDLLKHINVGVDQHVETLGQTLLDKLREGEAGAKRARAIETTASWLNTFCERTRRSINTPVSVALNEVSNAKRALTEGQSRLEALSSELLALEARGLSMSKLEDISARLVELEFSLGGFSSKESDRVRSSVQQHIENVSRTLASEKEQITELERTLETSLALGEADIRLFQRALSRLKERIVETETIRTKLSEFSALFPWSRKRPLVEYAVEAESIRKVAIEFLTAIAKEKLAQTTYSESVKRQAELKKRLTALQKRINRFEEAKVLLDTLTRDYSLEGAMHSALNQNRADIEKIFLAIHSPSEFKSIGSSLGTLIRKADGREANIGRISTGQRAAYALSIFLAQNAQLSLAPPVILMDDPIAHIDDMNVLSFLDYLREITLKGRRQIYFATANDKVAALFEHKFDFLGVEDFRRINLKRESQTVQ